MKKILILLICSVFFIPAVTAQDVSEKQEIAVFSLSYSDWSIPSGALDMVDQQVVAVLTNIGRFTVKGLEFRLNAADVNEFISMVKDVNEANMVIDEKFRLGEAVFTEADFQALVGSFIIVIPSLTSYDSVVKDGGNGAVWEVELQTSFTFILVKDSTALAQFSINTFGSGETQKEATGNAAESISSQLEYQLRSIEEFQLKSGIIEVLPWGNVIIELGANMGLEKGDEFSIVSSSTLSSGREITDSSGLLVISDVKDDVSFGKVIYSENPVTPGAQLTEIPRMGSDTSVYGGILLSVDDFGVSGGTIGIRNVLARGFYNLRPLFGIEVPIGVATANNVWPGLPLTVYGGGELFWLFGRFQVEPMVGLGATGLVPIQDEEKFVLTHIGGKAGLALNWMFSDSMRFFIEAGYSHWFSIAPDWVEDVEAYGGISGGLGVTFKL